MYPIFYIVFLSFFINPSFAAITTQNTTSLSTIEIHNFANNSLPVKKLISKALDLANQKIGYLYGSADPKNKGMDCSGTIYYLLNYIAIKDVPRSSDLIYQWAVQKGHFYPVLDHQFSSPQFSHLQPGDLLFWSGTYVVKRDINVTHVMFYLGKNKQGEPLMIGSSDGRTYKGKKIYGVSVFDFQLPDAQSKSKFLGYACIPHLNCAR
ncbi:MAG: NlpC/P60 family protein [bacterium]|nr:NlpC/P60 family protein [bacterium]